jgi:surface antigen
MERSLWLIAACLAGSLVSGPALGDPPPWAPAHGYYKKGKPKPPKSHPGSGIYAEIPPHGYIESGRCRREAIGKAVGAVLGGVAGARLGDKEPVAIIAGAIIGYVVGGSIGKGMDERDRACVGQVLEYSDDHNKVQWVNPDTNMHYEVTPTRTFRSGETYCREYTRTVVIDAKRESAHGTACRQPDGTWQIKS